MAENVNIQEAIAEALTKVLQNHIGESSQAGARQSQPDRRLEDSGGR